MTQKNSFNRKRKFICLPLWLVACIAVISIVIGMLIGGIRTKKDVPQENSVSVSSAADTAETSSVSDRVLSDADAEQWNLMLVNRWNALPDDYEPTLKYLQNGHAVDERCYDDLQAMIDDCRAAGFTPVICSSYRTRQKQEELFRNQVSKWLAAGYSQEEAQEAAGELVAVPGTSEHQLGLALDIVDISNQILDEQQENTDVQKWLMRNSWKYGFILRYPTDKSDITGISYEPWHYRYVGRQAAKEIYEQGICLEEYLDSLQ